MSTRSMRGVRVYRFGDFELDVRAAELRHGEEKVRLQEQPYRILTMLLERPGEVVMRDEICQRLWPNGTVVEMSHGINAAVLRLRDALGDSAENPRFVETVARRGYRFREQVTVEFRRTTAGQPREALGAFASDELSAGQPVAHFLVEEKLGRGGMGIVYRARDLNLGRPVALKFLAPEIAGDPIAVGRFQRESRTASALNHPNICTVYAVEECAGQPVIVMELLEGRTLETMLAAGPMAPGQALPLAIQTAAALEAAHRKGIVHRDLKPANIMVTQFGVKVLDFGLAKQVVSGAADRAGVTRSGSLLGTPNYMAPELFQGREADSRSDLYSFGAVLCEMLCGGGVTANPRGNLPPGAADLEPAVRRALEAKPEDRWQTAGDLRAALECALMARGSQPPARPALEYGSQEQGARSQEAGVRERWGNEGNLAGRRNRTGGARDIPSGRKIPLRPWILEKSRIAAGLLTVAAIGYGLALAGSPSRWNGWPLQAVHSLVTQTQPSGARSADAAPLNAPLPAAATAITRGERPPTLPAAFALSGTRPKPLGRFNISPDGQSLAYAVAGEIYVRSLDGHDTNLAASGSGTAGTPFWSPDGRSLAFTNGGHLYTVPAKGGTAMPIADVNTNLAGAWGRDGTILIGEIRDGLIAVPAAGGPARKITTPDPARGETRHLLPQFLPGRKFLYTAGSDKPDGGMLYAGSLDSAATTPIMPVESGAAFVAQKGSRGYLVFDRGNYLMAQAFDAATLQIGGDAIRIAGPVNGSRAAAATGITIPEFSATPSTLVYRSTAKPAVRFTLAAMSTDLKNGGESSGVVAMRNWMAALRR